MLPGVVGKEMWPVLGRDQVRLLDRLAIEQYGMSGLVLMENAGRGAVDVLCRLAGCFAAEGGKAVEAAQQASSSSAVFSARLESASGIGNFCSPCPLPSSPAAAHRTPEAMEASAWSRLEVRHRDFGGPVVICCGRGNNAGDGLVMARHLWLRGHAVRVFLWSKPEELSPDASANYAILQKTRFPVECFSAGHDPERLAQALAEASWIVDALLGTGARGQPRPPLDAVIAQMNAAGKPILAVDLPSGLDCQTGQAAEATIRAAVTCTFAAAKPGLLRPEAQPYVGHLVVLDIGTPPSLLHEVLASSRPE